MQGLNQRDVERAFSMKTAADIPPHNAKGKKRKNAQRRKVDTVTFNGYTFDRYKMMEEDHLEIQAAWPNGIF